jgi:hypothetical protein
LHRSGRGEAGTGCGNRCRASSAIRSRVGARRAREKVTRRQGRGPVPCRIRKGSPFADGFGQRAENPHCPAHEDELSRRAPAPRSRLEAHEMPAARQRLAHADDRGRRHVHDGAIDPAPQPVAELERIPPVTLLGGAVHSVVPIPASTEISGPSISGDFAKFISLRPDRDVVGFRKVEDDALSLVGRLEVFRLHRTGGRERAWASAGHPRHSRSTNRPRSCEGCPERDTAGDRNCKSAALVPPQDRVCHKGKGVRRAVRQRGRVYGRRRKSPVDIDTSRSAGSRAAPLSTNGDRGQWPPVIRRDHPLSVPRSRSGCADGANGCGWPLKTGLLS